MARNEPIFTSREPVPLEAPKDIRDYVAPIRLHKWLVIVLSLIGLLGGWLLGVRSSVSYASTTEILVGAGVVDPSAPASAALTSTISMTTESDIATSRAVARDARELLGTDEPLEDLLDRVSTTFGLGSNVLVITFTADTPAEARDGAAAFARSYLEFREAPLRASLDERTAEVRDQLEALQAEFEELTSELEDESIAPGQILKIQADADLVQADITLLSQDLSRLEALTVDAGTIVAGADLPTQPASGGRLTKVLYAAAGLLLGLMIGLVVAYLLETATDSLRGIGELEELLDAPVLGLVHEGTRRRRGPFVVDPHDDATLVQDVRAIRSVLLKAASEAGHRTFLVTSSTQREGRTTIAASLARVIASSDTRVILVSADLHAPALEPLFGVTPARDLADLLEGRAGFDEVLSATREEGLTVVAGRPLPADARGDLIESEAMASFLDQAAGRADLVILDSPPLVVADPLALASQVDAVIYVSDAKRAKRRRVARARVAIEQAGGTLVGSISNRFVPRRVRVGASQYRSEERQRRRYLSLNGADRAHATEHSSAPSDDPAPSDASAPSDDPA